MLRTLLAGAALAVIAAAGLASADDKVTLFAKEELADQGPSVFGEAEPVVAPAPDAAIAFTLPAGSTVVDFEVSPLGSEVAVATTDAAHRQHLGFWRFGASGFVRTVDIPDGTSIASLAWQPKGQSLFLLGARAGRSVVFSLDSAAASFTPSELLVSDKPLRRLVVGPRPFMVDESGQSFRLFFGEKQPDGKFALRTIDEKGKELYTVIGPAPDAMFKPRDDEEPPATLIGPSALPVGFHPAGNTLIWEDEKACLHKRFYDVNNWANVAPFGQGCGHIETYTPNGVATLEWSAKAKGLQLHDVFDGSSRAILTDYQLESVPSQTPDGKGIVDVTADSGVKTIRYLPIDVPLAGVANAWMYLSAPGDQKAFADNRGLFRPLLDDVQLYQLYDSEAYACGSPDSRVPTRPYYVTTDLFWELYGAAFDGLFIVTERAQAMPAFTRFVDGAADDLKAHHPDAKLAKAFAAARAVLDGHPETDPEAQAIVAAKGSAVSPVLGEAVDYAQFKPRGHYKTEAQQRYFRAMRYLSLAQLDDADAALIKGLGADVLKGGETWIAAYLPFIAASRLDLPFGSAGPKSTIASHPGGPGERLFPLSWAWDNEALDTVIAHAGWPPAEQIVDRNGAGRILPSGLDFASIAGSALAHRLLEQDGTIAKYPNLAPRLQVLRARFAEGGKQQPATLYDRWIEALATQWADSAAAPLVSGPLWDAKRLQTGLASWATLRHATVLVNDQTAAECGEGGFEDIVMQPPRGYVEPDPAAFTAIAGLFDATIAVVNASHLAPDEATDTQLRNGVLRRLTESRDNVNKYRAIAEKELKGQSLTSADYEAIQYVGRAAEHNFLIFNSLANADYALSTPDPMMKVADVAGAGATSGSLEAAVGRPLEWDQVVPFFGRSEIVKGSVYGYYEFVSQKPIDDDAWRKAVDRQARPTWVTPFVSATKLACPAVQR